MTTPVMDMYLFFTAAALIENGHNLSDILKLLTDPDYRSTLHHSEDITKLFWSEFETLSKREQRQEVSSTINKFYTLMADPRIRRMLSVNKKGICLADHLHDEVLHVRLPARKYGKSKVKLIGSLIISYITQLLLERNSPRPYDIFIDDCHLFAHDTVHNALVSTSRYGLSTTVACQHSGQLDPDLLGALLGSTQNRYVFRVSKDDADILNSEMPANHSKTSLDKLQLFAYRTLPWNKFEADGTTIPLEN